MITEWANIKVNVIWLAIGIVFIVFAIIYFRLVTKSSQEVGFENIEIDKLNEEEFTPTPGTAMEITMEITDAGPKATERSAGLKLIASQLNKVTGKFEQHLNQNIFPKVQKHLDEIYRTSSRGFLTAGILATVSAVLSFLSAFQVL